MTLLLRPPGRGNWGVLTMHIDGARASPLLVRAGQRIALGGMVFRICRVLP